MTIENIKIKYFNIFINTQFLSRVLNPIKNLYRKANTKKYLTVKNGRLTCQCLSEVRFIFNLLFHFFFINKIVAETKINPRIFSFPVVKIDNFSQ